MRQTGTHFPSAHRPFYTAEEKGDLEKGPEAPTITSHMAKLARQLNRSASRHPPRMPRAGLGESTQRSHRQVSMDLYMRLLVTVV